MDMWRSVIVRVNNHDQPVDPGNDRQYTQAAWVFAARRPSVQMSQPLANPFVTSRNVSAER
jgi:hypothetical protein